MITVAECLRAFFGGGIRRKRSVRIRIFTEGERVVCAVEAGGGSQDKFFDIELTAEFQQIQRACHVRINVDPGVLYGLPHARARSEVDYRVKIHLFEYVVQRVSIADVQTMELEDAPFL